MDKDDRISRTKASGIRYLYEYVVEGYGHFPYDMLRSDGAWFASSDSVYLAGVRCHRRILLRSYREPDEKRWNSFTWQIVPRHQKADPTKIPDTTKVGFDYVAEGWKKCVTARDMLNNAGTSEAKIIDAIATLDDGTDMIETYLADRRKELSLRDQLQAIIDCYGVGSTEAAFVKNVGPLIEEAKTFLKGEPMQSREQMLRGLDK